MRPHDLVGRWINEKDLVIASMGDGDRHIALGVVTFVNDRTGTVDVDLFHVNFLKGPHHHRFMYPGNQLLIQEITILNPELALHKQIIEHLA